MADIRPESEIDLFTDDALRDPYSLYQRLHDQVGVVWMRPTGMFAVSRCAEVRDVLRNWQVYSSARGTAMNEPINQAITGSTLAGDRPLHDNLRGALGQLLSPAAMRALAARIEVEAEGLVEPLVPDRASTPPPIWLNICRSPPSPFWWAFRRLAGNGCWIGARPLSTRSGRRISGAPTR